MDGPSALVSELRGNIHDERVLEAIAEVPRELFVPAVERHRAYENCALPIGCGQTISQPLVVARMLELLELGAGDRVLDVGTGSGYHAALLARLAGDVVSVERHAPLAEHARELLRELGVGNVRVLVGDGAAGFPPGAPYDAINIAAAATRVSPALEAQLGAGGRLVAPVGTEQQHLMLSRRTGAGVERHRLEPVKFVPLIEDSPLPPA